MDYLNSFGKIIGLLLIGIYRSFASAWLGGACRFEPSCSQFANEAFKRLSFFRALQLSLGRIARCRPGGGFGYDPVPNSNIICMKDRRGQHGQQ